MNLTQLNSLSIPLGGFFLLTELLVGQTTQRGEKFAAFYFDCDLTNRSPFSADTGKDRSEKDHQVFKKARKYCGAYESAEIDSIVRYLTFTFDERYKGEATRSYYVCFQRIDRDYENKTTDCSLVGHREIDLSTRSLSPTSGKTWEILSGDRAKRLLEQIEETGERYLTHEFPLSKDSSCDFGVRQDEFSPYRRVNCSFLDPDFGETSGFCGSGELLKGKKAESVGPATYTHSLNRSDFRALREKLELPHLAQRNKESLTCFVVPGT